MLVMVWKIDIEGWAGWRDLKAVGSARVCMYVCMYVCVCVYIYIYMYCTADL
jgi:hypothetical protein